MDALNACDEAYLAGDWLMFQRGEMLVFRILAK